MYGYEVLNIAVSRDQRSLARVIIVTSCKCIKTTFIIKSINLLLNKKRNKVDDLTFQLQHIHNLRLEF